ncbi:cytochrome c oxidase assembly protein [Chloroflexi bacterium]|nr:cytochrome c oxidase assembly protein [Chloroflexota bacterium]
MSFLGFSDSIWMHWHPHLEVVFGLILVQGAYLYGIGPYRKKQEHPEVINPLRTIMFTLGTLIIFISLTSPLHILSDRYLFSAHMLQHVLITLISPPLLILGTPGWLISKLFQPKWSLLIFKRIFHPLGAVVIFNLVFSMWHLPVLYNLSVTYHWVHILEHSLFIIASLVMWWPICSQVESIPKLPYPIQILYLFVMSLAQIIVFGIVTFAREPIYQHYIDAPRIWNITPLVDQQLGGILMKVGSGFLFLFLIIIAFFKWFDEGSNSTETRYNDIDST